MSAPIKERSRRPGTAPARRPAARAVEPPPARRHRRWPFVLVGLIVVVVAAAVGWLFWVSSVFGLTTITVRGVDTGLVGTVRAAAAVPQDTPLARIDTAAVQRRVAALPQVAAADVALAWPHGVVVTVQMRTPVAVTSANGGYWLLDSGGRPYQQVSTPPSGLVVVALATPGPTDPATSAALTVVQAMTSDFRATVSAVTADSAYNIVITLRDKRIVRWGGADASARKMQILPALLEQQGKVYDISDPGMVTVRQQ
jgi:cell division protein FtsQ